MRKCCPSPGPAPTRFFWNCETSFIRSCADGTGIVQVTIPAAYLATYRGEDETEAEAQLRANEYAESLARGRALRQTLTCNSLTPGDLADCGLVDERPANTPECAFVICDNVGNQFCTDDGFQLKVTP